MAGSFTVTTKLGSSVGESFTITDGTINQTATSLAILGHSAPVGYAYHLAKSLVDLLSNFASTPADKPVKPLIGQTWFDNSTRSLMIFTGSTNGWKQLYTDGATNMIIQPSQGGLGLTPGYSQAGYVIRVNSAGSGYELTPGSFVRTDASSSPLSNNTFDIGTASLTYKTIYASNFAGNATSADKLSTARTITLSGHVAGSVSFDGTNNVNIDARLVGGTLSQYIQRTGDSMNDNTPLYGGAGPSGGFRFPNDAFGGGGDWAGIYLDRVGTSGENQVLYIQCENDTMDGIHLVSGTIRMFTKNADGGNANERLTITPSSGYVGINNITPQANLHVIGNAIISDTLATHAANISGNSSIGGTLTVGGASAFNNMAVFANGLQVPSSGVATISRLGISNELYVSTGSTFVVESPNPTFSGNGGFNVNTPNTRFSGATMFAVDAAQAPFRGTITAGDVIVAASDKKLKKNIKEISGALETLSKIASYSFDFDKDACEKVGFTPVVEHDVGLIAQEVGSAIPEALYDNGQYKNYRERPLLAYIIAAINELNDKIDAINKKIDNTKD